MICKNEVLFVRNENLLDSEWHEVKVSNSRVIEVDGIVRKSVQTNDNLICKRMFLKYLFR